MSGKDALQAIECPRKPVPGCKSNLHRHSLTKKIVNTFPSIHTSNIARYNIWELLFWEVMSAACISSSSNTVWHFTFFFFFFFSQKFTLLCRSHPKHCILWLWAPKSYPITVKILFLKVKMYSSFKQNINSSF